MSREARLVVETGPCKGQKFVIEDGGSARAGRSSTSDISLNDPSVSRFHCRIFFKPGKGLWIADLGSANQTLVNGTSVQEAQLKPHDRIEIGDSTFTVVSDGSDPVAAVQTAALPVPPVSPGRTAPAGGIVDLGLTATEIRHKESKPNIRLLALLFVLMAMSVLVVWIFFFRNIGTRKPIANETEARIEDLELRYEKVDGSLSNIFQCIFVIQGTKAGIEFHDVADKKHFRKPLTDIDRKVIVNLWESVRNTGVLSLHQTDLIGNVKSTYTLRDLSVLSGTNSYRIRLLNTPEPSEFENARKILEGFGVNEFGIRSWAYPRGELEKLAGESMQIGLKLYDEKNVSHGNLYKSLRALNESAIFLETVDPKPDFYTDLTAKQELCDKELKTLVADLWFQAERARKIKDWPEAISVLRILCETVPDRSQKDYKEAEDQLADAERRIKK
ncbi:MAG: FHA domain-containing protein [bacterium]